MKTGEQFFSALYGHTECAPMSDVRYNLCTRKAGKPLKLMALPPTEINLHLHILRAHLQTLLAKAADQSGPPEVDLTDYGWERKDGLLLPAMSSSPPAPLELMEIIRCACKSQEKACSSTSCSCHSSRISCTLYCICGCSEKCCNPHKVADASVEEIETDESLESAMDDFEWE